MDEGSKSAMWRVAPEVAALVDELTKEIAADSALLAEVGTRGGKPTRAGVLRLLVTRGAKSIQGTLRERQKPTPAPTVAPTTKPKGTGKGGKR